MCSGRHIIAQALCQHIIQCSNPGSLPRWQRLGEGGPFPRFPAGDEGSLIFWGGGGVFFFPRNHREYAITLDYHD